MSNAPLGDNKGIKAVSDIVKGCLTVGAENCSAKYREGQRSSGLDFREW